MAIGLPQQGEGGAEMIKTSVSLLLLQQMQNLVDGNSLLPLLPNHLPHRLCYHLRAVRVELQLDVFGVGVPLELIVPWEGHLLVVEEPHRDTHRPHISRLAGVAVRTCELVFGAPEAGSASGEV